MPLGLQAQGTFLFEILTVFAILRHPKEFTRQKPKSCCILRYSLSLLFEAQES